MGHCRDLQVVYPLLWAQLLLKAEIAGVPELSSDSLASATAVKTVSVYLNVHMQHTAATSLCFILQCMA